MGVQVFADPRNCPQVSAYTQTGASYVNHYDPGQNLTAKAVWLVVGSCGGSFRKAFRGYPESEYRGTYQSSAETVLLRYQTQDGSKKENVTSGVHSDDYYELLAKGIAGYNQGASRFTNGNGNSWLDLLKRQPTLASAEMTRLKTLEKPTDAEKAMVARSTGMDYAMRIMHDADKMGLHHRKYIWRGGFGVDVNGDGEIKDIAADPDAEPPVEAVTETTVPWCFAYGEQEWRAGESFQTIKENAEGNIARDIQPVGRIRCDTGEAI